MSLYEVWQAAASSPFQPTVGKESQLLVGLTLLLIGLVLTGLFGLNRSSLSVPIFGIPASLAFGELKSPVANLPDKDLGRVIFNGQHPRFYGDIDLGEATLSASPIFSVEEARVVQGLTFLDKALFSTYTLALDDQDHALPPFTISIVALLETLQIFGIADANASSRNPYGGFSSSYGNAFSTPALALGGTCRISYQEVGAPLTITIQEGSVTTTCEMNTYEAHEDYEDDGGIPLDRNGLCLKVIMRSTWLNDAIGELSGTNPNVLVLNVSNRSAPYFSLEGEGGPFGDSTVDFSPESKSDPTPTGTRGKKQPLVTETFSVVSSSENQGRIRQRYKFDMIKRAGRAMALASKVSIRQDHQGVLSLQFMIDLGDGANNGPRRDENATVNAPPSPGSVAFVDFRFVPLVGDDESGSEDGLEGEQFGEQESGNLSP